MILAIDTEVSGLDWWHGSRAFYVTTCKDDGTQRNFRWRVDPYTRLVTVEQDDLEEIESLLEEADLVVGQNIKTEAHALHFAGMRMKFPWHKTVCTLNAGHLLASNQPHNLTDMVLHYLGDDIKPWEDALAEAVQECRRICRLKAFHDEKGEVAVAREGRPDMPSAGAQAWRADYWLPYEMAELQGLDEDHPWRLVLEDYSNRDSLYTLALWQAMEPLLRKHKGDYNRFLENMEVARITFEMEQYGLTRSKSRSARMQREFHQEELRHNDLCVSLALKSGFDLKMPKGAGVNNSLRGFIFDHLKLPVVGWTDKGSPSLDAAAMLHWTLTEDGLKGEFVKSLATKRKYSSAISALDAYDAYAVPDKGDAERLHPSINPVGTGTTRTSSSNPNGQNAGKGKDLEDGEKLASVREEFGPAEGREWYALDYDNIEMMLPAYYSGEQAMIELFERPDEAPYFGSYHLLNASIIYPDLFWPIADKKGLFKELYKASWYKHLKNFGFCVPLSSEALSRNCGWVGFDKIQIGDEVLGYDVLTKSMKWTKVLRKFKYSNKPLIRMENKYVCTVSTPNHRWVTSRRVCSRNIGSKIVDEMSETQAITTAHTIVLSAPTEDTGELPITPVEAAIIGFAYGDGSVVKSSKGPGPSRGVDGSKIGFQVKFYQKKHRGIRYIKNLLKSWGHDFKIYDYGPDRDTTWILDPNECRDIWRRAGLWDNQDFESFVRSMGTECRSAYLEAIWQAEGCVDRLGCRLYAQNNGSFAESIKLAVFMSGKFATTQDKKTNYPTDNTCIAIRESKPYVTGQRLVKSDAGRGDVWCIQTELGTWVMRQDGQMMITGNSVQYDAGDKTADAAAKRPGSFDKVVTSLPKLTAAKHATLAYAKRHGIVRTLPDLTVPGDEGYPLMVGRYENGAVKATTPWNYLIQGTAGWAKKKAMIRVDRKLKEWWKIEKFSGKIVLDVHDELIFDFPRGRKGNREKVLEIRRLMEKSGEDIGVPLRVSVSFHPVDWANEVKF